MYNFITAAIVVAFCECEEGKIWLLQCVSKLYEIKVFQRHLASVTPNSAEFFGVFLLFRLFSLTPLRLRNIH